MGKGKASKFKGEEQEGAMTNLLADSASDRPGFESQPHHLLTLGKLLKLSEPQFPNLYSGTNDSPHLVILLCRFCAGAWMKRLSLLLFSVTRSAGVWGGAQPTPHRPPPRTGSLLLSCFACPGTVTAPAFPSLLLRSLQTTSSLQSTFPREPPVYTSPGLGAGRLLAREAGTVWAPGTWHQ